MIFFWVRALMVWNFALRPVRTYDRAWSCKPKLKLLDFLDWLNYLNLTCLLLIYQVLLCHNKFLEIWLCLLSFVSCTDMRKPTSWETLKTCQFCLMVIMLMDHLWIYWIQLLSLRKVHWGFWVWSTKVFPAKLLRDFHYFLMLLHFFLHLDFSDLRNKFLIKIYIFVPRCYTNSSLLANELKLIQCCSHKNLLNLDFFFLKALKYRSLTLMKVKYFEVRSHLDSNVDGTDNFLCICLIYLFINSLWLMV